MVSGRLDPWELSVSEHELMARLGGVSGSAERVLAACREGVLSAAEGRYVAERLSVSENTGRSVRLGGRVIDSAGLSRNLSGCDEAFVIAVTLGAEVDRLLLKLSRLSAAEHMIADGYASALCEALCDGVSEMLSSGLSVAPRFSPGYGDLPLSLQPWLLDTLSAGKLIGITLGESLLMSPSKSVSAIMGIRK